MPNIIRFTPSEKWYYPESVELGNLAETKDYTPHTLMTIPLGASRVGGPILDLPPNMTIPSGMKFVAQLELSGFSSFDPEHLLPPNGYLFFFIGGYGDEGKVIYSNSSVTELERVVIEHDLWFWDGCLIKEVFSETEQLESRYVDDPKNGREWNYFAGCEKSKIYGIYTHCQKEEDEIIAITNSSNILLMQIGEDFTGEGVWSILIERDDLKALNFSKCSFEFGTS